MKLQTLVYFVSIAEEGSYTKASEKCFVSQPALSKAISEFEQELNCKLFERNGRNVELTEIGKILYDEAKIILNHCDILKEKASSMVHPIKIGYIIFSHLDFLMKNIQHLSDIPYMTVYDTVINIREKLMNDEIDFALLPNSSEFDLGDVSVHYFSKRYLYLLVHNTHPLFQRNSVVFNDLRSEPVISWDLIDLPCVAKAYDEQFFKHGIVPNVVARGKKMGDMISMMQQYKAVGLSGPITTLLSEKEYKLIPIKDSDQVFGLCGVWKKNNKNPALNKLIGHL